MKSLKEIFYTISHNNHLVHLQCKKIDRFLDNYPFFIIATLLAYFLLVILKVTVLTYLILGGFLYIVTLTSSTCLYLYFKKNQRLLDDYSHELKQSQWRLQKTQAPIILKGYGDINQVRIKMHSYYLKWPFVFIALHTFSFLTCLIAIMRS